MMNAIKKLTICMMLLAVILSASTAGYSQAISLTVNSQEWLLLMGQDAYWPVGCATQLTTTASDMDLVYIPPSTWNYVTDPVTCSLSTTTGDSWTVNGNNFTRTVTTPKYSDGTITVTADDSGVPYNDPPVPVGPFTDKVVFWGPEGSIQGPGEYCPRASVSYCIQVGPASKMTAALGAKIYWYYTKTASADNKILIGAGSYSNGYSSITMPTLAPTGKDSQGNPINDYKLWVRAEDRNTDGSIKRATPWDYATTKPFIVDELPQDLPCCGASKGGCSSCAAGSPDVDPMTGFVNPAKIWMPVMGLHGMMCPAPTNGDTKKCAGVSKIDVSNYSGCNGTSIMHAHVWTKCGNAYCINENNFSSSTNIAPLPNGDTLKRTSLGSGNWDFEWRSPDGTLVKHQVSNGTDRVYHVLNLDGSTTTSEINGSVHTYRDNQANGASPTAHNYTIDSGKITNYQSVSNNVVTSNTALTYNAANQVTQVTVAGPDDINKVIDMSYDSSGNLASVNQNGKITRYTRTTDAQGRLNIAVTIEDSLGVLYGKTEYLFDTYTTKITVRDAQNPSINTDQVTTYYYITDSSKNKRYLYKVVDPMGNINVSKVYVPVGYMTESGVITSGADTVFYKEDTNSGRWGSAISVTQLYDTLNAQTTTYVYDTLGRITSATYPQVAYGVTGSTVTEAQNTPVMTYGYTGDFMTSQTGLDGITTAYSYPNGQLYQEIVSRDGVTLTTTTYGYSANPGPVTSKQVITNSPSSNWLTQYTYFDSSSGVQAGLLQTETLRNGSDNKIQWVKTYYYLQGTPAQAQPGPTRVTTEYYNTNGITVYLTTIDTSIYDSYGKLASTTDSNNRTISMSSTLNQNQDQKTDRVIVTGNAYIEKVSDCCKVLNTTDMNGSTTYNVYDAIGRLIKSYTNENGQNETTPLIQTDYDGFGRVSSVTSRKNASTPLQTTYSYDKLNRVTAISNPGNQANSLLYYDVYGRLLAKSLASGRTTMYRYDALNRVVDTYNLTSLPSPVVLPSTGAAAHNIYYRGTSALMAVNQTVGQMRMGLDSLDRLASVYWPHVGKSVTYTYDTMGRKSSMSYDGNTTNYEYGLTGSLATVKLGTDSVATYTRNNVGNLTHVLFGNSTWQDFSYGSDARYMLTGIDYAYKCNSGDTLSNKGGIRVTRNDSGYPLSWADNTDKFIKTYDYDSLGRLANADIPGAGRMSYSYDWAGNLLLPTAVYNDANQLTSLNSSSYTYNSEGDMLTGAGKTYTYTNAGMVNTVTANGTTYTHSWDGIGNRISYNDGSTTTKYVYDLSEASPTMIAETNGSNATNALFVHDDDGQLLMRKAGTDLKYYHFDEAGNTLFLTDASGVATDKYVYDARGQVVSATGTTNNPYMYLANMGGYTHKEGASYTTTIGNIIYEPASGLFAQPVSNNANGKAYRVDALTSYGSNPKKLKPIDYGLCMEIAKEINKFAKMLNKRYHDMVKDIFGEYEQEMRGGDPRNVCFEKLLNRQKAGYNWLTGLNSKGESIGTWTGHKKQYEGWRNGLYNRFMDWLKERCDDKRGGGPGSSVLEIDLVYKYLQRPAPLHPAYIIIEPSVQATIGPEFLPFAWVLCRLAAGAAVVEAPAVPAPIYRPFPLKPVPVR